MDNVRISDLPESQLTANLSNSIFVFVDLESDVTFKIPASDMNLGGGGGGGGSTLLPWQVVSSNTNAVDGSRFIANTSNGSFFINLPAAPVVGSFVEIADDNNFANTNLFLSGNGNTIENDYLGIEVDIGALIIQLIYNGDTWQIFASSATAEVPNFVDEDTGAVKVPGTGEIGQVQYAGPKGFIKGTPTITTNGRSVVLKTYKPNRIEVGTLGISGNFWYTEHGNLETFEVSNTAYFTYSYYGSGVSVDNQGNFYVIGGNGQDKALYVKYDTTGNVLTSNSISYSQYSFTTGECVSVDPNQNAFIITVNTDGFGNTVSTLTKLDANGNQNWSKTSFLIPEGIGVEDMNLDSNNHIHFVGSKRFGNKQGIIVKLNEFGDTIYQKNVVSTNANSQIVTTSSLHIKDDFIYYSSIENKDTTLNNNFQKIVVKADLSGNTIWKKVLPEINAKNVSFLPILVDSSNNVIVLEPFFSDSSNLYQTVIHVLDDEGNFSTAVKLYSATKDIQLIASQIDANNNYYFSGLTLNDNLNSDIILLKLNSDFDVEWKKTFGKLTENDYQYYNFGHKALKYVNDKIFLTGYSFVSNTQNANASAMQTMFSAYLSADGSLDGNYDGIFFSELADVIQTNYAGFVTSNSNVLISDDLFFDAINLNLNINVSPEIITVDSSNTANSNVFYDFIPIVTGNDRSYFLPLSDGTPGQALVTDGSGNVYWKSVTISNEPFDAVIVLNWTGKDIIRMTLVGNIIITNDVTGVFDGQKCILELKQPPGGNASVTFTDETRFSVSIPFFDPTTTGGKTDKIGFIFNAPDDKYDVVAISMGH